MRQTGILVNVVRVGQLCGSSTHGGWNEKEWVPAMVKWSQTLGAIPDRDGVSLMGSCCDSICVDIWAIFKLVSWLQVDVAASALLEMCSSAEPVLHVVHPNPVEWRLIVESISKNLAVESIPYDA